MSAPRPQRTAALLDRLCESGIRFAVVGGVAAIIHGSASLTHDLDIVMPFTDETIRRLLDALRPLNPRHATRPDLSLLDEPPERLLEFRMILIETEFGRLDVLPGLEPFGEFASVPTEAHELFGRRCQVVTLEALIAVKERTGRRKDVEAVHELRAIRARRGGS